MIQNNGFIYLACPYTHADDVVQQARFCKLITAASALMMLGYTVHAPVLSGVPVATFGNVENTHEFWMQQDLPLLAKANEMLILTLEGWQDSAGITEEIWYADTLDLPYQCITYKDLMKGKFNAIRTQPVPYGVKDCSSRIILPR